MQIAQVIGGYTLGGADLLRRAMGKKKPEEMAQQRDIFVAGAEKNGLARAEGDAALRPDGEVRRLRLQQVARRRVRAARLPDGVLQGAPRRRRSWRRTCRWSWTTPTRCSQFYDDAVAQRPHDPAARRQRIATTASSRSTRSSIRYGLGAHQGHRRGGDRRDRRRARRGRPVHATCSISAAASTSASSTGASSRRWCAPARSTRSIARRASLFASVGVALDAGERAERRGVAGVAVRRGAGAARRRAMIYDAASGRKPSG